MTANGPLALSPISALSHILVESREAFSCQRRKTASHFSASCSRSRRLPQFPERLFRF